MFNGLMRSEIQMKFSLDETSRISRFKFDSLIWDWFFAIANSNTDTLIN